MLTLGSARRRKRGRLEDQALSQLPLPTKVRVVLGLCGLVLVAVGGALFAFVTYPRETVRLLGAA